MCTHRACYKYSTNMEQLESRTVCDENRAHKVCKNTKRNLDVLRKIAQLEKLEILLKQFHEIWKSSVSSGVSGNVYGDCFYSKPFFNCDRIQHVFKLSERINKYITLREERLLDFLNDLTKYRGNIPQTKCKCVVCFVTSLSLIHIQFVNSDTQIVFNRSMKSALNIEVIIVWLFWFQFTHNFENEYCPFRYSAGSYQNRFQLTLSVSLLVLYTYVINNNN